MELSLSYDYEYFDHALNGTGEAPNPKNELTLFRTTQLKVGYAFSDRLRMNAWFPYRQITAPKTDDPGGPNETRFTRRFSGLGDVIAMGYYRATKQTTARAPSLTLGLGVRLPTGSSQPDHDWGTGISRDPVLQVGTGTLDPIFAAITSLPLGKTQVFGNAVARLSTGQNIHAYRYGDEYQAGFGLIRQMTDWLDMSIAASGIFTGHDSDKGIRVTNTGGEWLYLTPGITLRSGLINTTVSMQIPIHQNVNESQLASDYVFSLGLSCGLDTRRGSAGSKSLTLPPVPTGRGGQHAADIETISLGEEITLADHAVSGRYTIFEFYGDRCLSCAALEPELRAYVSSTPDVAWRKINIGFGESPVVAQYQITETPTLIVFDRDGDQVLRYTGIELDRVREAVGR